MTKQRKDIFYTIDEKKYLSVTNILKIVDKSGPLMWWFGSEIYDALLLEPTLSKEEAMKAPYRTNKKAKERGTEVHYLVENYKHGKPIETSNEILVPYAKAFNDFLATHKLEVIDNERTVRSDKYGYAGTLDMLAKVNGKLLIVDIKTGKDLYPEVQLQTSAYRQALREQGVEVEGCSALLLKEDGTFVFESHTDKLKYFIAAKVLYEGINFERLVKLGYLEDK